MTNSTPDPGMIPHPTAERPWNGSAPGRSLARVRVAHVWEWKGMEGNGGKSLPPSLRSVAIEKRQDQHPAPTDDLKSENRPQTARAVLAGRSVAIGGGEE